MSSTRLPRRRPKGIEQHVADAISRADLRFLRKGWPDFLIYDRAGRVRLMVEAKGPGDNLSREQAIVHELLRSAGLDVRVVRLGDLHGLKAALDALARSQPPRQTRQRREPVSAARRAAVIMSLPSFPQHRRPA